MTGGWLSALAQLTCLDVTCKYHCDTGRQLEHLSSLTALRQLSVNSDYMSASDLSGIQQLSQLTGLALATSEWNRNIISTWSSLTALQSLTLTRVKVQPEAFPGLTQLLALSLVDVRYSEGLPHGAPLEQLLSAVSQLTLLTQLTFRVDLTLPLPPAAAFAALAASTHLHSLHLGLRFNIVNRNDVQCQALWGVAPPREQQLQQLCSCQP
jgi:hypothetical protein